MEVKGEETLLPQWLQFLLELCVSHPRISAFVGMMPPNVFVAAGQSESFEYWTSAIQLELASAL